MEDATALRNEIAVIHRSIIARRLAGEIADDTFPTT
jgi:hypothetical protein